MDYYSDKEKKTKKLLDQAESLVEEIFQAEGSLKSYLTFAQKMQGYLQKNVLLIKTQQPDAEWVNSYSEWKKQGFSVRRGEKGLQILLPEEGRNGRLAYRQGYVFDVSQLNITAEQREELLAGRRRAQIKVQNAGRMFEALQQAALTYKIQILVSGEETGEEPAVVYPRDNVVFLHPDLTIWEKYIYALKNVAMVILEREERWGLEALQVQADMAACLMAESFGMTGDSSKLQGLQAIQQMDIVQKERLLQDVSWVSDLLQEELTVVLKRMEEENTERVQDEGQFPEEIRPEESENVQGREAKTPDKKKEGKIQDFGEKIGGAKKDLWKERGLGIEDISDLNEAEAAKYITKDNIWKKPDYLQMMADGVSPRVAFFIKEVRNALPSKVTYSYSDKSPEQIRKRQKDYINMIQYFKEKLLNIGSESEVRKFYDKIVDDGIYLKKERDHYVSRTPEGYAVTNKLLRAMLVQDFYYLDRKMEKEQFKKATEDKIPAGYVIQKEGGGWRVKKSYHILVEGLQTEQEAVAWVKEHNRKVRSTRKKKFVPPQLEHVRRDGPSFGVSEAVPADGERYLADFGFRGGEFGNWMSEKDRQASLNMGYDAFCDLAEALQISTLDISLGNRLSIAFGSRGRGGAAAHYEPMREVINLTKMHGAGSLAHEWGHALDDLIGKQLGMRGCMTQNEGSSLLPPSMKKVLEVMRHRPATAEESARRWEKKTASDKRRFQYMADSLLPQYRLNEKQQEEWRQLKEKVIEAASKLASLPETELQLGGEQIDALVEELSQYRKKTTNHIMNKEEKLNLFIILSNIKADYEFAREANDYVETDFYRNSVKADQQYSKEDKGYWHSPTEMFARAFACYVKDKLAWRSDYLCGHAESAVFLDSKEDKVHPLYPVGEERRRINEAMDELMAECRQLGIFQDKQQEMAVNYRRAGKKR